MHTYYIREDCSLSSKTVLLLEPGPHTYLLDEQFDNACRAIADFADLKSPYTLGHSIGVAAFAEKAARSCGIPEADCVIVRRVGLLHDIGRVGASAGIWGKAGPLSEREWKRVRLHPYYTERVPARPGLLEQLGALAALHHERLDGSGYYRGSLQPHLTTRGGSGTNGKGVAGPIELASSFLAM